MSTAVATEYPTRMYIDGAWCDATNGGTLAVINPADESVLAEVAYGGREDADRAIKAAARAFPEWRAGVGLRSRQDPEEDRRADARPCRPHRASPDAGTRQAAGAKPRWRCCTRPTPSSGSPKRESGRTDGSFRRRTLPSATTPSSTPSAWLAPSRPGTSRPPCPAARSRRPWPRAARS